MRHGILDLLWSRLTRHRPAPQLQALHLVVVGLLLAAGCGGGRDLGNGRFEANVYIHDGLGLRIPFPRDWAIVRGEKRNRLDQNGRKLLSSGDPTGGTYSGAGAPTSRTLFTVYRYPLGTVEGINPSLVGALENILARPQIQTAMDYLQELQKFLSRGGMPMKFDPIVPASILGGKEFAVMPVTLQPGTSRIGQIYFCRLVDDEILTLVATFSNPGEWHDLKSVLDKITFSK